jgi:adenosylhomocysteine nucleosidase
MRFGEPWNGSGPTAMSKVGIVAALEREIQPFIRGWNASDKQHEGRQFRFFQNEKFVLVCGGIGAEAARRAAEALIVLYQPSRIYSVGYAGALVPILKVGNLIQPARVINSSDGSSVEVRGGEGVLVSYSAVASPEQKIKLRDAFSAQAVDMESSAVASASQARGVEFRAVKVISDEFDFEFPSTERFVDGQGQFSDGRFALFAAVRPWLWPRVIRLARNSRQATRSLCEHLGTILGGQVPSTALSQAADGPSFKK